MRMILHALEKDFRRLWPAAAITWIMLAFLAREDHWRADWMASSTEGWLNLLLTMAWAFLGALAVLEEPLIGESNFWTTRPHRWPELLTAKLVFVLLTIHLPSLIADAWVLSARSFNPLSYLGVLLGKQVLFFAAVTFPCMALATLVRSFTHFVILMFVIATGIAILNGGMQTMPVWGPVIGVRHTVIRIVLIAAAVAIVWLQYARRLVVPGRIVAVLSMLVAASISAWLPVRAEYSAAGSARRSPRIVFRNATPPDAAALLLRTPGTHVVNLPIEILPAESGQHLRVRLVEVEIVKPNGTRLKSIQPSPNRPLQKIDLTAGAYLTSRPTEPYALPDWLSLDVSAQAWERIKTARVHVRGVMGFDIIRTGRTMELALDKSTELSDLGRCSATPSEDRFSQTMLKVFCESPREIPPAIVNLTQPSSPRPWKSRLNSAAAYTPGPHETWLSPLHRAETYFRLTASVSTAQGSGWLVPSRDLPQSHLEITPEFIDGHAFTTFDLGEIELSSWLAEPDNARIAR